MRCTTILNKVLSHSGIFVLMLWNSGGNMSVDLVNLDRIVNTACDSMYHKRFQISIKRWFQDRQANVDEVWVCDEEEK